MFKHILTKLAFTVTRIPLVLAVMKAKLIPTVTVEYSFTVKITSGPLTGNNYSGSFSYNASAIKGKGFETIRLKDELKLNFNFLETSYTEVDDVASRNPNAPFVNFFNGQIMGLYYVVRSAAVSGASFSIFEHDFNSGELGQGSISYTRSSSLFPNTKPIKPATVDGTFVAGKECTCHQAQLM
jgi:hypothetical protein